MLKAWEHYVVCILYWSAIRQVMQSVCWSAGETQAADSSSPDVGAFQHTILNIDTSPAACGKWLDLAEVSLQHGLQFLQAPVIVVPHMLHLGTVLICWLALVCCKHQHLKVLILFICSLERCLFVDT